MTIVTVNFTGADGFLWYADIAIKSSGVKKFSVVLDDQAIGCGSCELDVDQDSIFIGYTQMVYT